MGLQQTSLVNCYGSTQISENYALNRREWDLSTVYLAGSNKILFSFRLPTLWIRILLLLSINAKTADVSMEFISGGKHHGTGIAQDWLIMIWSFSLSQVVTKFDQFLKQNTITKDLASTDLQERLKCCWLRYLPCICRIKILIYMIPNTWFELRVSFCV